MEYEECNEDDLEWVPCQCGDEYCKMQVCHNCGDILATDC